MPSYNNNHLDDTVNSELMRVCKCMIPYLDRDIQKNIAIGLKFLELVNTINAYKDENVLQGLSLTRQDHWEDDLLHSVRSNISPDKAYLIDAVMKLKEVRSIMSNKDSQTSPFPQSTPDDARFQPSLYNSDTLDSEPSPSQSSNLSSPSPTSILQAVSPLLDDNQRQLLNLFTTFFNNK